jgi:hypothetical protein
LGFSRQRFLEGGKFHRSLSLLIFLFGTTLKT